MDITVRDAQATAMWRFHDTALERAALIYTFARSTNEDLPPGTQLHGRQLVMLIDLVHEFCFNVRRALERAEKFEEGLIAFSQQLKIHFEAELELSNFEEPSKVPLTQESYWWVLGRIIHSRETQVIYRTVDIVVDDQRTGRHHSIRQPVALGFSSDWDGANIDHYVRLESLVHIYVGALAHRVESAVNKRNRPARKGSA